MTLIENLKQQVNELTENVNTMRAPEGLQNLCQVQMPKDFEFPLSSLEEVDKIEEWLIQDQNRNAQEMIVS